MTLEDAFASVLEAKLTPILLEMRQLAAAINSMNRCLPPALLDPGEAAKALGVSLSTVRRRIKDGTLPVRRIGRSLRVDLSALNPPAERDVICLAEVAKRS
jgi:excisionase family DNA binding protein